ncbi:MAG: hypothetical protein WB661_09470 [Candidatus Bathyarchaeia archaeon]|jgi:hypothetical protein
MSRETFYFYYEFLDDCLHLHGTHVVGSYLLQPVRRFIGDVPPVKRMYYGRFESDPL